MSGNETGDCVSGLECHFLPYIADIFFSPTFRIALILVAILITRYEKRFSKPMVAQIVIILLLLMSIISELRGLLYHG